MNSEEKIIQMLEGSRQRGNRATVDEVDLLVRHLHVSRWRRRANRVANALSTLVVFLAAGLTMAWTPIPEYSSYKTSQGGSTPEADCQMLHQMIEQK
jgi:hypothetical protein